MRRQADLTHGCGSSGGGAKGRGAASSRTASSRRGAEEGDSGGAGAWAGAVASASAASASASAAAPPLARWPLLVVVAALPPLPAPPLPPPPPNQPIASWGSGGWWLVLSGSACVKLACRLGGLRGRRQTIGTAQARAFSKGDDQVVLVRVVYVVIELVGCVCARCVAFGRDEKKRSSRLEPRQDGFAPCKGVRLSASPAPFAKHNPDTTT